MKLYIAGPMRGYPLFNYPAFDEAAAYVRSLGMQAVSPAEKDRKWGVDEARPETAVNIDMAKVMRWDLRQVLSCDGIVLLPGWHNSQGARLERIVAESTGRKIFLYTEGKLVPAQAWHHPDIFTPGRRI